MVEQIAAAGKEQSEGIEQINRAVSEMDSVTQQNAALVEEAAAAAESLKDQADRLSSAVGVFKVGEGDAQLTAKRTAVINVPTSRAAPITPAAIT
jgi:uncharacterized phage infection (PIP) family protein YhgE